MTDARTVIDAHIDAFNTRNATAVYRELEWE